MPSFPDLPLRKPESKAQDGYVRLKDVYIPTRDGSVLCANVYLPTVDDQSTKFPCLLSLGPYGKDVHFSDFGKPKTDMYANMAKAIPLGPDACFETPDPIVWCNEYKYALIRVDTRGSGGSPGKLDPFGLGRSIEIGRDAEGEDAYDIVEWAGTQEWSNGKVALGGISYLGMACYWTAMQQPPHLAAIVAYEALTDVFGHTTRQGGVFHSGFQKHWFNNIVVPQQYGKLEGVDEADLEKARFDFTGLESFWKWRSEGAWPVLDRYRDLQKVKVPLLSAGNWMDSEVHLPGNLVAFEDSASSRKFLEMHTGNHLAAYYAPEQLERQRTFLDYFLLDKKDNGLDKAPQIDLLIRKGAEGFYRSEPSWPPQDAEYVAAYLAPGDKLTFTPYSATSTDDAITFVGLTGSTEFVTEPFQSDLEVLGYPYLDLTVSTTAKDMDLFVYFYLISAAGEKVVFRGNHDEPALSFLRSWFRLSSRALSDKSTARRPILDQQAPAPVKAGEPYQVKVPIPPTSMIFEKGTRLAVALRADDEETTIPPMRHVGPDRSEEVFGGTHRVLHGGKLVLPVVKRGS